MTTFGTWFEAVSRSFLPFAARLTFPALLVLTAKPCRGSDSWQTTVTLVGSSSNMFFIAINARVDLPGWPNERRAPAELLESNGMYSIDISMEAPEELLPGSSSPAWLSIGQVLAIYAELTEAELQVEENVRDFSGPIRFPRYSEMTRTQAREFVETALWEQAGVEVFQVDSNHAVVRFGKKPNR